MIPEWVFLLSLPVDLAAAAAMVWFLGRWPVHGPRRW